MNVAAAERLMCPVDRCERELLTRPNGMPEVICRRHWRRIPWSLQIRIAELSRSLQAEPTARTRSALALAVRAAVRIAERRPS